MEVLRVFDEHDAIYDCAWSEFNRNLILSGCGDGEIKLWDINDGKLIFSRRDHKGEV